MQRKIGRPSFRERSSATLPQSCQWIGAPARSVSQRVAACAGRPAKARSRMTVRRRTMPLGKQDLRAFASSPASGVPLAPSDVMNKHIHSAAIAIALVSILGAGCGSGGGGQNFNLISIEEEWQLGRQLSQDVA